MYDEVLTKLIPTKNAREAFEGEFIYREGKVSIVVDADGEDIDVTRWLARKFLLNLAEYDAKARATAAEKMLKTYNETWRQEDEPLLTKAQFTERLTLVHVSFLGVESVDFMYADDGMFGGHSLIPQSFDGETFTYVQMYG
ncbi:MAG: DUF2262 domain-containing protein [Pseudomonadota bacterium]